jgi:hypothetical protein
MGRRHPDEKLVRSHHLTIKEQDGTAVLANSLAFASG